MKKLFIIILFINILPVFLYAQSNKPIRAEMDAGSAEENPYKTLNLGSKGVMVLYKANEFLDRKTQNWVFTYYDINLTKVWIKKIPLNEDYVYQRFLYTNDTLYIMLLTSGKKSVEENLKFIKFDLKRGAYNTVTGSVAEKPSLTFLEIRNNKAFFTIENKSNNFLYFFDLLNGYKKEVQIETKDNSYIESMLVDTVNSKLYVISKLIVSKKENKFTLRCFNLEGSELSKTELLPFEADKKFITANMTFTSDWKVIITGSYNFIDEKPVYYTDINILEAAGVYFTKFDSNIQTKPQFISFLEFNNIYKYLNKKEASKVSTIQEDKKSGKNPSLNYLLLEHDVLHVNDKLILVAEAFYPEYRTVSSMSYDYYGRMVPTTRTVFEGYRYTNAFIICFDNNGKIVWNNLFDIWNIITMDLHERVSIMPIDKEYIISYNNDGEIVYKVLNDSSIVSEVDNLKIELPYSNDKIVDNISSSLDRWYDNYYLAYGMQVIKNNSLANRSKRTVFYLNKIAFQ